jgi:4-diphosphocytidyl-2-C-methyl-D-erythritol kinase
VKLTLFAPAKINLGLAVTGILENGYHALDTIFTTLNTGDVLSLEPRRAGISLEIAGLDLPTNSENLVYRAAERYLELAGIKAGVNLVLKKNLPIAAGLGGGSSDAAATLRGLSRIYPSDIDLPALAKSLGADVPFLLEAVSGQFTAARAQGIGEILEPLEMPQVHLVLANPGVGITAKEAYIGLKGRFGNPLEVEAIIKSLEQNLAPPYRNDLEIPVLEAYPIVGEVKKELERAGLFGVLMSGSGSTCFGLAHDVQQATKAATQLSRAHPDWWICPTSTQGPHDELA